MKSHAISGLKRWGLALATMAILIGAVFGAYALIDGPRADPSQAGLATTWGRYGPTLSFADRQEEADIWHLHCRRTPSQCLSRAQRLCEGEFFSQVLPIESGRIEVEQTVFMRPSFRGMPEPGLTFRDWLEGSEPRSTSRARLVFATGHRVECR